MEICELHTGFSTLNSSRIVLNKSRSHSRNSKTLQTKLQKLQLPLSICHLKEAFVDGGSMYMLPRVILTSTRFNFIFS